MLDLIRDIEGQPAALIDNAAILERAYAELPAWIDSGDFVVTGMATSLWAWHSATIVAQSAAARLTLVDTSEYLRYGPVADDASPIVITSRSGESAEIVKVLDRLRPGRGVIGVTATAGSTLAQRSSHILAFRAEEAAFCNTQSFLMTLAVALASAAGVSGRRDLAPVAWVKKTADAVAGIVSQTSGAFEEAAAALSGARVALITSRGHLLGVAQQAALDLQEGMRLAALPVPGGLLRHGPLELIRLADSAMIMLLPNDHMAATMIQAAQDVIANGTPVIIFSASEVPSPAGSVEIRVPDLGIELAPIVFAVALQRLNVALAEALGMSAIEPVLIPKVTRVE
ncbi:SIS domain-containing protein [Sinorhizobium meliloti]|uniref:SIS domain-containing protein n=1 Tax=Rhizobium meliloti TaxID=382 RepID=UPI00398CF4F0